MYSNLDDERDYFWGGGGREGGWEKEGERTLISHLACLFFKIASSERWHSSTAFHQAHCV